MKLNLKLNKKKLKNFSENAQALPKEMTAAVGGGSRSGGVYVPTKSPACHIKE